MSKDRKIIEHEGVKYYKEEGQWYKTTIFPIKEDEVPDAVKNKMLSKLNLLPEIQLDVLKYLDFTQLVSVQQTNVYFKNFIYEHGKVLAKKKFFGLGINQISERGLNNFKERMPPLNLYDFKWDEHKPCEQKQKFFKLEPQLYEFQLSEQLEEKWKGAIEKPIPLFLSMDDFSAVIFELEQRFKWGTEQYYFQLMNFPKNIEEMKITRYFFQLLFNCAFEVFQVSRLIINPQMIELLFDENITNLPLQIHSQLIDLFFFGDYSLNFILNHLIADDLIIDCDIVKDVDLIFQILVKGDKFSNITLLYINSKSYFFIIERIETSQNISKIIKEIQFIFLAGSNIKNEKAKNIKIKIEDKKKISEYQLSNKYNPKMKFSVTNEEYASGYRNSVIKRIN